MEKFAQEVVDNIKQEVENEEVEVSDQFSSEIVGNIKHEPERHFVFIMPDDPEPETNRVKEFEIALKKFDRKWKQPSELFESYFFCDKCDFVTRHPNHLYQHSKLCKKCKNCGSTSKPENVKNCGFCDLKFDCKNCRTKHRVLDHLKGSKWHCSKCEYETSNKDSLRIHYQSHVRKFSCETCKQMFSFKSNLRYHQQQHRHGVFSSGKEIKFECGSCVRSFATASGLRCHEKRVHSQIKFHCDICGKTSKIKGNLRIHLQMHFKIPCPICQQIFTESNLKKHVEQHSTSAKFKCGACEKVYFNKNRLYYHKKKNHEIDQVQCDLCGKIFQNKVLLRTHMNYHLKVSCKICKQLIGKTNLKRHMEKLHSSNQMLLGCNIRNCHQKFKNIEELNDHEEIHIGTGKYKCPKCDHRTKTMQRVKTHLKAKHKT